MFKMFCPLSKRGDGLVGCVVQFLDFDGMTGLERSPGRRGLASEFALGFVADGDDQRGEAKVEELSRAFQAGSAVGPGHYGCPATEVDRLIALRGKRRGCEAQPAEELVPACFLLGSDIERDSLGHTCVCAVRVVVTVKGATTDAIFVPMLVLGHCECFSASQYMP